MQGRMQHPGAQRAMGVTVNAIAFAAVSMEKLRAQWVRPALQVQSGFVSYRNLSKAKCAISCMFLIQSRAVWAPDVTLISLPVVFTSTLVKLHQEN